MSLLSFFGFGNSKLKEALLKGAVIIDVRTAYEFDQGHVPEAINIPVDRIAANFERIRGMNKPVIVCCASGVRSGTAAAALRAKGLRNVINGGSWVRVMKVVRSL